MDAGSGRGVQCPGETVVAAEEVADADKRVSADDASRKLLPIDARSHGDPFRVTVDGRRVFTLLFRRSLPAARDTGGDRRRIR